MTVGEVEELSGRSRAFLPARLSFHDSGAVERTQYPSANMEEFMTGTSHKGASQMLRLDFYGSGHVVHLYLQPAVRINHLVRNKVSDLVSAAVRDI